MEEEIFQNIVMSWFYTHPVFFKLFCLYSLRQNFEIPCAFRSGDKVIEYNPEIVEKETQTNLQRELLIEFERIILRHPFRRPEEEINFDKTLWFEASTMTITQKNVLAYGLEPNRNIEYYYYKLKEINEEKSENDEDSDSDNNSGSGISNGADFKSEEMSGFYCPSLEENDFFDSEEKSVVEEERQEEELEIAEAGSELWTCDDESREQEIQTFIKENSQMGWGNMPGNFNGLLIESLKAKIPSCINLLEYFKNLRNRGDRTCTRMRPNRRFGYAQMGSKTKPVPGKILIGVDVSGSISNKSLSAFYGAIKNVFDRSIKHIDVFQFDTELKGEKPLPFKKSGSIKISGRGGTDFQPIFEYAKKNQNQYDGLIIFSDGFAAEVKVPSSFRMKVLWVLDSAEGYEKLSARLKKTGFVTVIESQ